MKPKQTCRFFLGLLIIVFVIIRLPFLQTMNLGVAPIENYDVARSLAYEGRYISTIKANFFYQTPILHPAAGEVNLIYPFFVAFLIKIGFHYSGIQYVNSLMALGIVIILFFLISHNFGLRIGFWSALLISVNPYFSRMSILVTEDIFFLLIITIVLMILFLMKENVAKTIFLGIGAGLAFMTRNTGLFLFLALAIYYGYFLKNYKKVLILFAVFCISIIPLFFMIALQKGNIGSWLVTDLIKRHDDDRGFWLGLHLQAPIFKDFLRENFTSIIKKNLVLFYLYIKGLVDFRFLSFLSIFLLKLKSRHFSSDPVKILFIFALLNLLVFTTFLNGSDEYHYLLPSFIFLLPFALLALKDLRLPFMIIKLHYNHLKISFFSIVASLVLLIYIIKLGISVIELDQENYFQAEFYQPVCEWARNTTNKNTNYAATIPWVFNLLADRPTIIFPHIKTRAELTEFITKYNVHYLVVDTGFEPYGHEMRFGMVFMNDIYKQINQESPDLLQLKFSHSYIKLNTKFHIYVFKVNHKEISCSALSHQPGHQSFGVT